MEPRQPDSFDDPPTQTHVTSVPGTDDDAAATCIATGAAFGGADVGTSAKRGRYVILRQHAAGGLGTVSIAVDAHLKRQVALKEIRPDRSHRAHLRQRFTSEAEITSLLEHPGIVPIYSFDEDVDGRPYYAMRLVQGRTLCAAIQAFHAGGVRSHEERTTTPWGAVAGDRPRPQPVPAPAHDVPQDVQQPRPSFRSMAFRDLLQRFIAVCNTVAFAHSKGVIHRDLKPSNVMIGEYGETLVLDWGLAKRVAGMESTNHLNGASARGDEPAAAATNGLESDALTEFGQVLGTAPYMSPEQARGTQVGMATDVYALGAILYEMLTGCRPYHGSSSTAVLDQLIAGPPSPPTHVHGKVPKALEAVCLQAMARDPGARYATVAALARDVEHWLADEPLAAHAETWLERIGRWTRKHRPVLIGAALAVMLLALALLVGLLVVTALNRNLDKTNKELANALQREAAERHNANASEQAARNAEKEADRQKREAQEALADTQAFSDFLVQDVLAAARPEKERGGQGLNVTVRQAVDEAVKNLPTRFEGRPKAEACARHDLGVTYRLIGDLAKAEEELTQALKLRREHLGNNHEETLRSLNSLAVTLGARGKFAESLPLYEDAYRRRLDKLGPTHRETLTSLNNLASTYQALGNLPQALPLLEETLRLRRAHLEPNHPDVFTSMNNLARAYQAAGRWDSAVPIFEETLQLRLKHFGPDHPHVWISKDNLAIAYRSVGRLKEALALFEEVSTQRQEKLGKDHPDTLTSRSGLGTALLALGRAGDALPVLEETLANRTNKLGPAHTDTITSMSNLANAYRDLNRVEQALALYEQVFQLYGAQLGSDHPYALTAMHNLGHAYQAAGRRDEGLGLLEKALELRKSKLGVDHPSTLSSMSQVGMIYVLVGKTDEGLALGQEALRARRAKFGDYHHDTLTSLRNVAAAHVARKEYAEAERCLLDCQAAVERNANNLPKSLREDTIPRLVQLYESWGKPAEAQRWRPQMTPAAQLREGVEKQAAWPLFWGWPRF